MLDPTPTPATTVHLDPSTLRLLWGALVALVTLVGAALGLALRGLQAGRAWSRRSDRAEATDDLVHGPGRTREAPAPDAPGLVSRTEQLEDVTEALARRASTVERRVLGVDLGDPDAVLDHVAEHLDTQRLQALTEDRLARRPERPQPLPAPRLRPDGRHRGEPE